MDGGSNSDEGSDALVLYVYYNPFKVCTVQLWVYINQPLLKKNKHRTDALYLILVTHVARPNRGQGLPSPTHFWGRGEDLSVILIDLA